MWLNLWPLSRNSPELKFQILCFLAVIDEWHRLAEARAGVSSEIDQKLPYVQFFRTMPIETWLPSNGRAHLSPGRTTESIAESTTQNRREVRNESSRLCCCCRYDPRLHWKSMLLLLLLLLLMMLLLCWSDRSVPCCLEQFFLQFFFGLVCINYIWDFLRCKCNVVSKLKQTKGWMNGNNSCTNNSQINLK